jgi:hypothetical protein
MISDIKDKGVEDPVAPYLVQEKITPFPEVVGNWISCLGFLV